MNNKYLVLGHLTFLFLFIFAFIFGNERVLFIDSGAQVFEFIRDEGFEIYAQRYSMYLFQLLPVLLIKLHAPLAVVIYSYSVSFLIIAYILWLITVYFLKNQPVGILMLFVMLGIRQTFFHSISETFQLMYFAAFLYAWVFQTRDYSSVIRQIVYYTVALLIIILCVFIHPVAIFFVVFILGMYVLDKNKTFFSKIMITVLTVGVLVFKFFVMEKDGYDARFAISMQEFFARMTSLFSLSSTKWYFQRIVDFYWLPLILFVLSSVFYWKNKKYWHFAFNLCFVIGFWLVTVIIYSDSGNGIGRERSFLPLFFFCSIPFMTEVFPVLSKKWNNVFFVVLVVAIMGGFVKIAVAAKPYTERLNKIEEIAILANKEGKKKLLIEKETADKIFPLIGWGTGFESMMYTALKGQDSIVNIYVAEETIDFSDKRYIDPEVYLAVPWWMFWKIDELNPHYFKLPKQPVSLLVLEDGNMKIKDFEVIDKEE